MPADIGGQTLSLKYQSAGNSQEINERFVGVRQTGIYSGGLLTVVDDTHASLATLVCEIGDGTHQVRVETTSVVSVTVGVGTPYVILRWSYTGNTSDFMEILAVASGSVLSTDLVVGKCSFAGSVLNGFDYGDATHSRTAPNVQDLWLKVLPRGSGSLKALVYPGYYQAHDQSVFVPLQETDALVPPSASSKVYLVYFNTSTGAVAIDSTGVEGASPSPPDYTGRLVLAEITLASSDTEITVDAIKDVRPFVTHGRQSADGTTITADADGKLKVVDADYIVTRTVGNQLQGQASWTALSDYGSVIKSNNLTVAAGGIFTLNAGKLYRMNYNVLFRRVTESPEVQCRFRVLTGDTSWWYTDDEYNQSWTRVELWDDEDAHSQLSGTFLILPASETTLQLEVVTEDAGGQEATVWGATISIWSR
jgi:hypothetical protein